MMVGQSTMMVANQSFNPCINNQLVSNPHKAMMRYGDDSQVRIPDCFACLLKGEVNHILRVVTELVDSRCEVVTYVGLEHAHGDDSDEE